MPLYHCCRLEDVQRVQHVGHQAIETSEHEPIDVVEDKPLWRLAPQHVALMTKDGNFSVQCSAKPEQPGHYAPNQSAEIADRTEYQPIRRPVSHVAFAVGTRGFKADPQPSVRKLLYRRWGLDSLLVAPERQVLLEPAQLTGDAVELITLEGKQLRCFRLPRRLRRWWGSISSIRCVKSQMDIPGRSATISATL
jgi:hypothetical protein